MKKKQKTSIFPYIKDLLVACFCMIILLGMIGLIYFKGIRMQGYAMMPTFHDRDLLIAKKTKKLNRFDLVVFKISDKQQIRRVIALSGETIQYSNDVLLIDGEPIDEKFIVDEINESQRNGRNYTENFFNGLKTIPKGYCLVLGDNRPYATDSRHYGLIQTRNIIGVIRMRLLPINDLHSY